MSNINRIPPNSLEAEQSVLGAMLLDEEAVPIAAGLISGEDFYREAHKEIFEAIADIYKKGEPIDLITLSERLKQRNTIETVGGVPYLVQLQSIVPSIRNIEHYANIILEKSLLRGLIKASSNTIASCYEAKEDIKTIVDDVEKSIFDVTMKNIKKKLTKVGISLFDTFDRIEERCKSESKLSGIPTGFYDLDRKLSGLQKGDLILVAARPSMGKSAFALNIAENASIHEKTSTAMFSLEMPEEQLKYRLLSSRALVELNRIRAGTLDEDDWIKLSKVSGPIMDAPLYIDDTPYQTVTDIKSKSRRLKAEADLGLLIIDYLGYIKSERRYESRQMEIGESTKQLKALAKELEIPVILLAQLSRAPEMRADHRPILSDLRESGAIEQDGDVVMFLYRDEYYKPTSEKRNISEVIIAKQRNGETGTVELGWMGEYTKFVNISRL